MGLEKMNDRERDEYACKVKLESITPDINFTNAVTLFMDHVEKSLKEISDQMLKAEVEKPETAARLKSGEVKSVEELREKLKIKQTVEDMDNTIHASAL